MHGTTLMLSSPVGRVRVMTQDITSVLRVHADGLLQLYQEVCWGR